MIHLPVTIAAKRRDDGLLSLKQAGVEIGTGDFCRNGGFFLTNTTCWFQLFGKEKIHLPYFSMADFRRHISYHVEQLLKNQGA